MKFLVHYNLARTHAYGIWWDAGDGAQNLYSDPSSGMAARGRLIVYNRDNPGVSWDDFCTQLADQTPYFDEWTVYDPMGMSPEEMLRALQDRTALAG